MNAVDLQIEGMTCASCAMRIEKKLNKLPGVEATVNYATEKAHVVLPEGFTVTDAIAVVESAGYGARAPQPEAEADPALTVLGRRLLISAVLTVPVVLLAMIHPLQFAGWEWVSLVLATPVILWGAAPFHRAAWVNARHRATTMDTLISIGVLAAYVWSIYVLLSGIDMADVYFEVGAAVTVFILTGRHLEARAKHRSSEALRMLASLGAKDVSVLRSGVEVLIPIEQLHVGDVFIVRPGEKVATDGVVEEGSSAIDASLITGEPVPVEVGPGDHVVGATMNAGGRLLVRASEVGASTQLARIAHLVEQAQTGKAPIQRLADRVSAIFVPIVLGLSVLTLLGWLIAGHSIQAALTAAIAVLIIACPCALGLATPTALMVGTGRGAQLGILIRGPEVLEATRRIDTIVLDKTGTVTTGRMAVHDVIAADGFTVDEVLSLAGAVEDASEHPIARSIADEARERFGSVSSVESFTSTQGLGVQAVVGGRAVVVGRASWLATEWSIADSLSEVRSARESMGSTVIAVGVDGALAGLIVVADEVKGNSASAIAGLRAIGLEPVLLTGDNARAATAVAAEVHVDRVHAEVLPQDKLDVVRGLQAEGRVVAMAGDGINDAAALVAADLGMAMGTGTDIAIEAADITLMRGDLMSAVDAIRLSRATLRTIKGNLFWAFAYNIAAIPLAMAGLLNPMVAGAAMALSSVFVVTNSLRLRRFKQTAVS